MPDNYISQIDFGDGVVRKLRAEGGDGSLSALSDVDIINPSERQVIAYNASTQKWENKTVGNTVITLLPVQTGTLTYNGTEQTPTWDYYSVNQLEISGDVSATNAGTYTALFTPKIGFCWDDYTTSAKSITWTIGKADGYVLFDKESVTLNKNNTVDNVIINASSTITATSSDTTLITVSLNSNVLTVSAVNTGEVYYTSVIIDIAESTNYFATSATLSVTGNFVHIYGVEWDGTASTKWTRTDDSANFEDPNPYYSGMATTPSSPFDNILPWSGMTIEEFGDNGGTMVKIPKFWYSLVQNGTGLKIQIADGEVDGFHVSPAHMDRGDGQGERDVVYIGRYHVDETNFRSTASKRPKVNYETTIRTPIHNHGGSDVWQIDFAMMFTIWLLYLVEFADWNSQKCIGMGCNSTGTASSVYTTGRTTNMGYHTGSTASSRDTLSATQYRNIEELWGNCFDWIDGCRSSSDNFYIILNPNNFGSTSAGINIGVTNVFMSSPSYPRNNLKVASPEGLFPLFVFANYTGYVGTGSTYVCDTMGGYSDHLSWGGSYWHTNSDCGMFHIMGGAKANYQGARNMKLPNNT